MLREAPDRQAPDRQVPDRQVVSRTRAMASNVSIHACTRADVDDMPSRLAPAAHVFSAVEAACTRFDPSSPLMQANARAREWTAVGRICFEALVEAHRAYQLTKGRFDPRVLADLVALGYAGSLPFAGGNVQLNGQLPLPRQALEPWEPRFRRQSATVMLGPRPVDLGGIAKGLAVRWSSQALPGVPDHLIEAGGDCWCAGSAPDSGPWRVAVEDPAGGSQPVAVLALRDRACATSSVRLRKWRIGDDAVHHILDPSTGRPGGTGLASVTVVGSDPAVAEVWSKVLFLEGIGGIGRLAEQRGLAALWVSESGIIGTSPPMEEHVLWRAS